MYEIGPRRRRDAARPSEGRADVAPGARERRRAHVRRALGELARACAPTERATFEIKPLLNDFRRREPIIHYDEGQRPRAVEFNRVQSIKLRQHAHRAVFSHVLSVFRQHFQ